MPLYLAHCGTFSYETSLAQQLSPNFGLAGILRQCRGLLRGSVLHSDLRHRRATARRRYRSPARGQRPHRRRHRRHHGARRGSTPFASAAGLSTSLPPARARPEHRKTTRGETYMLQTTKEHCCLSTQPRPRGHARPQFGCLSLASRAQYVAPATLQPVALYYYKIYIAGSSHQCKKTLASGTVFVESSLSTLEDFPTLKLSP